MRAYSVFDTKAGETEGACLVFANSAHEARWIGHDVLKCWWDDCGWLDVRARWLRDAGDEIFEQAKSESPHVIECPISCEDCMLWGKEMSVANPGYCLDCEQIEEL